MALIVITLVASIAIFGIAFVSPKYGRRIQYYARKYATIAYKYLRKLPTLLQKMAQGTVKIVHKIIHKSAAKGKKRRRKAPF